MYVHPHVLCFHWNFFVVLIVNTYVHTYELVYAVIKCI